MAIEFSVQEARNILNGLDRSCPELEILDHGQSVYMTRDEQARVFEIYGVENTEHNEPLYELKAKDKEEYVFVNRYYRLRGGGEGQLPPEELPDVD